MNSTYKSFMLLFGVSVTTALADNYKISLDFNQANADGTGTGNTTTGILGAMPGQTTGDVWNNIPVGNAWVGFHPTNPGLANGGASGGVATNTKVLNRTTGAASPISLAVASFNASGVSASGQRFNSNSNAFIAADAFSLMRDYLFQNNGTVTLTLSGFVPSETYTLYLYGAGNNNTQGGTWSVLPAEGATFVGADNTTAAESANPNLTAGQDYIVVTFDGSSPTRTFTMNDSTRSINGFQLDAINAPNFANLAITGGASQDVGVPFEITVTAQNGNGDTVADSTTPVSLSSPVVGSLLEFDWNMDGTYGDNSGTLVNGVKVVRVRTTKAQVGTSITAFAGSATNNPLFTFNAAAGVYSKLQILAPGEAAAPGTATGKTGSPSIRVVQDAFNLTVNAVDSFWNVLPSATADPEVTFTSTDSLANLPFGGPLSSNASTFSGSFGSIGIFTITATDTNNAQISATTPALTVYGSPLTWQGNGTNNFWDTVTPNWVGGNTYANPSQVTFDSAGSVTPAVNIVGSVSPSLVTVNSTTNYTFSGAGSIAGAFGGFIKAGSGSLTVSTGNTYTGKTTVSGGILILDNATALPAASPLALTGGLIGLQNGDFTRALGSGAGEVTLTSGSGFAAFGANRVLNFGGASAPISWDVGFLAADAILTLSASSATHTLDFQNPITLSSGTNFFNVNDGAAAIDAILSGPITGGGVGLSKAGSGTLMLNNTGNAYTGFGTFIDGGTLLLGASEVIPNGLQVVIKRANAAGNSNGVLDINGFDETVQGITFGENNTNSGNVGQQPSLINSGASNAVITMSGGPLTYVAGSASFLNAAATVSANLSTGTGLRAIVVGNGSATEDLVITGNLTGESIEKTGLGTLRIAKPLNTGNTTVTTGTMILGSTNPNNDASAVTIAATGATLQLDYAGTEAVSTVVIGTTTYTSGILAGFAGPGITVVPQITGAGTLTVGTPPADPFLAWAGNNPAILFNGDENNDGVTNGLAWFLGAGSPTAEANGLVPSVNQTAGALVLTFVCLDGPSRGSAVFEVQASSDLGLLDQWTGTTVPGAVGTFTAGAVDFEVTAGPSAGRLTVVATIPAAEAAVGKVFGRIKGVN